jgi:hypothetical protein
MLAQKIALLRQPSWRDALEDADWFSRYATNLTPRDPRLEKMRRLVVERLYAVRTGQPVDAEP